VGIKSPLAKDQAQRVGCDLFIVHDQDSFHGVVSLGERLRSDETPVSVMPDLGYKPAELTGIFDQLLSSRQHSAPLLLLRPEMLSGQT
jgi:hypothetical protein